MLFNTFLTEYKRQAALHRPALWLRLQQANLTLIASTENAESPIGPIEAQQVTPKAKSIVYFHSF